MQHKASSSGAGERRPRRGLPGIAVWFALAWLLTVGGAWPVRGAAPVPANTPERNAFRAATQAFQDSQWIAAESWFGKFLQEYPGSSFRMDAVLMQAQSRFQLKDYTNVIQLLNAQLAEAGPRADEVRYWIAESQYQAGQYQDAAASYAQLIANHPGSSRGLEAAFGEAQARFRTGEFDRVVQILRDPNGVFQKAAQARPNDEPALRGRLLLGQVLYQRKDHAGAEEVLNALNQPTLRPDLKWECQYLLSRLLADTGRFPLALQMATNLLQTATSLSQKPREAESNALQGEILELSGDPAAAIQAYERNTVPGLPEERRREALLKIIQLTQIQSGKAAEAIQRLKKFGEDYPKDPALDMVRVTAGELMLREFHRSGDTNQLQQALAEFDQVIATFGASPLLGKAQLNRGWCLWHLGRIPESQGAFREAAQRLPLSEDQAIARFKLGETFFYQRDYTNAVQSFGSVIRDYDAIPSVKTGLMESALYQMLRASIELGDLAQAGDAVDRILRGYPDGAYGDRSMLLLGQALNRVDQPAKAREVFAQFVQRFPQSPLLPDVQIAIARTHKQEGAWLPAIDCFNAWVTNFPTHPALPDAEYERAWLYDRLGQGTNALPLFTNFVARFPTNALAPQAQMWVGVFYFKHGDYVKAESAYQKLYQSWPGGELAYRAQMEAGRTAYARRSINEARKYYMDLLNLLLPDTNSPPGLEAEAWFFLGDMIFEQYIADPEKGAEAWQDSQTAFSKITERFPTNSLAYRAWGRIGDLYLQQAQLPRAEARIFESAAEAYRKAMASPEISVRSQAEVGLGMVLEKQGKADQALTTYSNVIYGNNLKGDQPDPKWVKAAGLEAGRLLEDQQQWEQAIKLYQRLMEQLPQMRAFWTSRIDLATARLNGAAKKP